MALRCLRRSLTLSSSSIMGRSSVAVSSAVVLQQSQAPTLVSQNHHNTNYLKSQICWFRSSPLVSARYNNNNNDDDDKIGPDTILFEGCDYNHWLITMDFPQDPKPTPEEMVETYVQTLAKVVGSVEEAKKRMYACSTTTYQGFQAVVTEEMSEKFRGLPGVVFILPDSYIDPVNKEYGGDKYDNGVITHRPPPVQYGRGGRYGDRNRSQGSVQGDVRRNYGPGDGNYGPQRNNPPQRNFGPNPTGQGGERSYPAQQNYATQQNYGPNPTGQGERGNPMTGNRDYAPGGRGPMPSYPRDLPQAGMNDYAPPGNRDFRGDNMNFSPPAGGDYRQGGPPAGGDYRQGGPPVGGDYRQGGPPVGGDYRQGGPPAGGNYRQGGPPAGGDYRQGGPPAGGDYRQGAGPRFDQNIGSGAGQRFPQTQQMDGSPMEQHQHQQGGGY